MRSVLASVLFTLRTSCRDRVALRLEILALRVVFPTSAVLLVTRHVHLLTQWGAHIALGH